MGVFGRVGESMKTARRVAGASAVVLAALAAFATEAARATPCTDSVAAAPVFDAWGDPRAYDEVPGGSFEGGLAWTPAGAAGLAPAVDFPAADGTNSTAAHLEADDASITSPAFCVNDHDPSVRFLARAPEPGSHLKVAVLWTEADGKEKAKQIADLDAKRYSSAIPSATLALRDIVPRDGTRDVRLVFRMDGGSGSWLVDGVYMSRTATPACADVQATPVFAPWGDWDQYVALTGGTFEGPLSWATTGETAIVSESNPHPIGGSGRRALKISGMGSATSPPMCLDSRYPHFRFFAQRSPRDRSSGSRRSGRTRAASKTWSRLTPRAARGTRLGGSRAGWNSAARSRSRRSCDRSSSGSTSPAALRNG